VDVYKELGIEPIINAAGTLTHLGGSLILPEVMEAMVAASRMFVDMEELHRAAGKHIAELIGVEGAHVCSGGAAGITLMAAACMTGTGSARIRRLPDTSVLRRKFVVQQAHRNPFDQALRLAGGEFVEISASTNELEQALAGDDVAAVYYTFAWFCVRPALPLAQVAQMAHRRGVPVIVDAAAEVPPVENLWRFVKEGADLVTFSGGKAMRGPQSSGLILGKAALIEACRLNDNPNMGVGRPMKAGKEEIAGLVRAVELYMARDHAADSLAWDRRVARVIEIVSEVNHVRAWRQLPYGIGQQIPHAALTWDEQALGATCQDLQQQLKDGRPRIAVQLVTPSSYDFAGFESSQIRVHPHTLREGEEVVVAERIRDILAPQ